MIGFVNKHLSLKLLYRTNTTSDVSNVSGNIKQYW